MSPPKESPCEAVISKMPELNCRSISPQHPSFSCHSVVPLPLGERNEHLHSTEQFTLCCYLTSSFSPHNLARLVLLSPFSSQGIRKFKEVARGCTAQKGQRWDADPGLLDSKPWPLGGLHLPSSAPAFIFPHLPPYTYTLRGSWSDLGPPRPSQRLLLPQPLTTSPASTTWCGCLLSMCSDPRGRS